MKRTFISEYIVDGKMLLDPDAGVSIGFADIEADSARDESGYLHRIVTRHDVRTWGFSYSTLTAEEYEYLMALFQGKSAFKLEITDANGIKEDVTCYCTKKSTSYYSKRLGLYKNLKFDIVEC